MVDRRFDVLQVPLAITGEGERVERRVGSRSHIAGRTCFRLSSSGDLAKTNGGVVDPGLSCFLPTPLVQTQEIGDLFLVVESDHAVAEDEGSVGLVGGVTGGAAALGLHLVAEVADEAAVELEGEVRDVSGAQLGEALPEAVE